MNGIDYIAYKMLAEYAAEKGFGSKSLQSKENQDSSQELSRNDVERAPSTTDLMDNSHE